MTDHVIGVSHLVKVYGGYPAVCDVSFRVRRGEIFALLGPNGAGKTTVSEVLSFVKEPTHGFAYVLDSEIIFLETGSHRGAKEKIGVLPQGFAGFDRLTVRETVDYLAHMYERHADVDGLIDRLGLGEKRNALFRDLSGGERRRVGIAAALVNDPEVLFLDEPTTGLDPGSRRDVWALLKEFKARGGTVFLTTHYMDEAQALADRVCVIHKGQIVAEGSPDELIDRHGGGSTLVVRGCCAEAAEALAGAVPGLEAAGDDLIARLPEGDGIETLARAISALRTGGYPCKEISIRRPTLEDVFLRLTGEQLAEK